MNEPTLEFYKGSVEGLTGGEVRWRETIVVPEIWWRDQNPTRKGNGTLQTSLIHIFGITRSAEELASTTKGFGWMDG